MASVISLLEEQRTLHTRLYELSLEKRRVIAKDQTERLGEIVQEEMRLLSRMNSLEKKREKVLAEWAKNLACAPEDVTLTKILGKAGRTEREQISSLRTELSSLMVTLRTLNDENKKLLESKLEYTDTMLGLYVGAEDPLNNIYGAGGRTEDEMRKSTGMFDWEA